MKKYFFTSESVTEGHPDKICDKISDKILDEALKHDKNSKMAVEATIKSDLVFIYGEATTNAKLDYAKIAKFVLEDIGYKDNFEFIVKVSRQSREINKAVEQEKVCAGDQGIMFGYATDETDEYMPLPILLANKITKRLAYVRKNDANSFLRPDGKAQVTVQYENGKIKRIDTIIIACQHDEKVTRKELEKYVMKEIINKVIDSNLIDTDTHILINTSGSFVLGGPYADSGTTGRKIVCDTYGGMARVGGGALSSKDPSKVDRSAAYYARYVAKNIIMHGYAKKCEIQVSYAIGIEKPISLFIDTFGTEMVDIEHIYNYIDNNFNFSVTNIINELDLCRPIYYELAAYGHFGRKELNLPWERFKK